MKKQLRAEFYVISDSVLYCVRILLMQYEAIFVFVLESQCAAKKLAKVLLSSVSEDSYWPPLGPPPAAWLQREGAAASKDAMYPTFKPPQRYSTYWYVSSLFSWKVHVSV